MQYQLRLYRLRAGSEDEFVQRWRRDIVPARRANGFAVVGAWRTEDGEFAWIVRNDGPGSFQDTNDRYYASAEKAAIEWDPADYIESSELRVMEAVEGFDA